MLHEIEKNRRAFGCLGCGSVIFGILMLLFLRGVSATDMGPFNGSWALIAFGFAVLIAVALSKLKRG